MWKVNPIFKKGITTSRHEFLEEKWEWSHIVYDVNGRAVFFFGDVRPFDKIPLDDVRLCCSETVVLSAAQTVRFTKELLRLVGKKAVIEDA